MSTLMRIPGRSLVLLIGLSVCLPTAWSQGAAKELVPPRRAFVPLKDLQVLVDQDQRGVLMPRKEFEELLKQAEQHLESTGQPPTPQVLSKCDYAATIVGDQLLITMTAELAQLAPHWKIWKFPLQRLALEKATVNDQPALVGRTDDGALTVVTKGRGTHQLKLEFSSEIVTIGSDRAAGFALLPSATGELTLTVDAGKRLVVDGAELDRPQPIEQPAEYRVAVGGKAQVQLRITDRASDRAADALILATTGYGLVVAPGEVTWHALTTLQVFGRPVDRLTLSVPGYLEIADVESTGLEAWELQDDPTNPQRTKITLTYGQAFEGSRKIAVRGVMAVPTGSAWSGPPLTIENVTSHVGQIIIQHPAEVRLQVIEADGVRRATESQQAVSDMPEDMPTGVAIQRLRFDAWREDFSLRLIAAPKEREVHAAIASVLDIATAEVQVQSAITVTPRYAPLFDLDVDIPAEWLVIGVTSSNEEALTWRVLPQEPGTNRVRVLLPAALAPGASTFVKLRLRRDIEGWPVENDPIIFELPELVAPQANVVETAYVIRGDADLEIAAQDVTGLDIVPLKAEWERLRFQSQDTRYSAKLKVTRRRAQVAVETIGFYRLDRQTLAATLFTTLSIDGGGVREVFVSLPEAVPDSQRFEAVGATLVEQQAVGVENGRRQWRLRFAERVLGQLRIWTDLTLPRSDDAATASCPVLEVANADRSYGAIVVEAGADQRLTITTSDAQGQPLGEMDPLELPPMPYQLKERIVAVYRTIALGNTLTLAEERFEKAAVPTAVCTKLEILTILSRTGELQQRADFHLRLAGVQQLQVQLDDGTELWAATLDDEPVEIRRTDGQLLIALPSEATGEYEATLGVFYRTATAALSTAGTLLETPPVLSVYAGQGTAQPVDVLEQTWSLVHPQDTLVIDNGTALEPTSPLDQPGWITRTGELLRAPDVEDVVWMAIFMAIIAGAYAFLIMIYRRFRGVGVAVSLLSAVVLGFVVVPCVLLSTLNVSRQNASRYYDNSSVEFTLSQRNGNYPKNTVVGLSADAFESSTPAPTSAPMDAAAAFDMDTDGLVRESAEQQLRRTINERDEQMQGKDAGIADSRRLKELSDQTKSLSEMEVDKELKARQPSSQTPMPGLAGAAGPEPAAAGMPAAPPMPAEEPPMAGERLQEEFAPAVEFLAAGVADPFQTKLSLAIRQTQGLLSLALALDRPEGTVEKTFRYIGGSGSGTGVPLQVDYVDRRGGAAFRGFLFAVGLVLGWWLRRVTVATKTILVVVGLAVGLGLAPVAPVTWLTTLDGIGFAVLGLIVAWLLWSSGRLLEGCQQCCRKWFGPAALLLVLCAGSIASAQEQPLQAVAKPAPEPPPIPPAQILVYDDPKAPLAADRVFVPYQKFVQLYRLAHPEKFDQSPAPATAQLVEALYSATFTPAAGGTDASITMQARLTILSYVDGQQPVALPIRDVILKSAQLDGAPAAVVTQGVPWNVLIPKPGLHVLDLEFVVPAKGTNDAGSFAMKLDPTPAAKLAFKLPQAELGVRVNGSTSAYRRVTRDDATQIELPVGAGGDLQIAWQPEQARGGAAVVHVESVTAVSVVDAGVSVSIGFSYKVRQGVVRDVSFQLPEGLQLQTVAGPDVGGWELVGDAPQRKLRVFLRRNVNDATQLTLDGFLAQRVDQELAFRVPEVVPQEVTTEAGTIAVFAAEPFSMRSENVSQLNQIDAAKFEPAVPVSRPSAAAQLAYRFSRRPWTIDLRVTRLSTQLRAAVHHGVLVTHHKVQHTVRAECELSRMPRSSLSFQVPSAWLVLDVQSAGLVDWYRTDADDGSATITLDFDGPRQGSLPVVVTATESRDPTAANLGVSTLQVLGAERQASQLAVWLDPGLIAQSADLGNWTALDATTISGVLRQLRPSDAQLAYSSSALDPGPVQLTLTRLQPMLSATSLTVVTVTDVALIYGFVFQWQIERASTEVLTLEAPASLTNRMQFHAPEIRDAVPTPVDDNTTRWTISLRGPVSGEFRLAASASLPPATTVVPAPALRFVSVDAGAAASLETQQHYVLLINTSLSQLTSVDGSLVEPVQREDVDLVVRQELVNQATEFVRVLRVGAPPSWTLQRYTPAAAVPAAVNLADMMTVVARDGSYRSVVTYTIKNRTRQFLALRLPKDVRLLSVLVNQQPSRAVTTTIANAPAYLIALPKTSAVDLSFPVQVIYAGRLSQALPARNGLVPAAIDVPSAEVVGQDESAEYGIPVARTQWTIYLPDDLNAAPVKDANRHNLNVARDDAAEESIVQVLLSDAEEVMDAVGTVNNYYAKTRALSNLKQLDQALSNYREADGRTVERAKQAEKLKNTVEQLEKSIAEQQSGVTNGTVVITDGSVSFSDLNVNGRVQGGDANVQLGRAINNNSALFFDNGNDGVKLGDALSSDFSFQVQTQTSSGAAEAAQQAAQAANPYGNSLQARQQYQRFNEAQLEGLNSGLDASKKMWMANEFDSNSDRKGDSKPQSGNGQAQQWEKRNSGMGDVQRNYRIDAPGADAAPNQMGRFSGAATDRGGSVPFRSRLDADSLQEFGAIAVPANGPLPGGGPMLGMQVGGGAAGGVGGMGGGGFAAGNVDEAMNFIAGGENGWTQPGGLSLPIQLPTAGQKLVFSKAGGDARLALNLQTRQSYERGLGVVWALVCGAVALIVVIALRSPQRRAALTRWLPIAVAVFAGTAAVFLVRDFVLPALVVFVIAAGIAAWMHRNPAEAES